MAHDSQKNLTIKIEQGNWSDEANLWIAQAVHPANLQGIKYQVDQQIAKLFYLWNDIDICGAFVLRIDTNGIGSEGVIVAAAADLHGVDLMATCMPAIEKKFIGCGAIRYHTNRPAVAKKMARFGFVADEIVCRKEMKNG